MELWLGATSCFDGNSDSGDCCCSGAAILYGLPSAPRTAAAGASCCRYGYPTVLSSSDSRSRLPPELFRFAVRRVCRLPEPLTEGMVACPECRVEMPEHHIRDHLCRCPCMGDGGGGSVDVFTHVHGVVVRELRDILRECGAATFVEMPGVIRDSHERPGDIVAISVGGVGRHWVIDVSVVSVLTDDRLRSGYVGLVPGAAARGAEQGKRQRYQARVEAAEHRFIPFIMEEGGRLGQEAISLLEELVTLRVDRFRQSEDWGVRVPELRRRILQGWLVRLSEACHEGVCGPAFYCLQRARAGLR